MCEFVSWVEWNNKLYYLTDAEVFSDLGREKLAGCKDNDYLGHNAIRKFWGIPDKEGTNCEIQNFWELDKLPKEISDKIKEFDKWWVNIWEKYFMNDDLRCIIYNAPATYKAKAAKQLLLQKASNEELN